jgi:mono/diheme cytochrome c family protein
MLKLKRLIALSLFVVLSACGGSQQAENGESSTQTTQAEKDQPEETAAAPEPAANENPLGEKVYKQYCFACHQMDGRGVPGNFPPLIKTDWVNGEKERLIKLVINGMEGPIQVNGEVYNSVMTPHGFLSDEEIAAVLTYVRSNFENNSSAVTVEEVQQIRASLTEGAQ